MDTLRETLAHALPDEVVQRVIRACPNNATWEEWTVPLRAAIVDAVLPLVEQAIQQDREKWMAIVREVQDECDAILNEQPDVKSERLVAAAEGVRAILPLMAQAEKRAEAAESALAEKDAQIAALQAAWKKTCLCGDAEKCL